MHATLPRRGPSFPFHDCARRATSVLLLLGSSACGGSSGALVPSNGGLLDNGLGSFFIATAHQNGSSNDLRITGLEWGRLVDVFETTGDPLEPIGLVFRDLLIDHSITASTLDFEFSANPVSGKEFVIVSYPRTSVEFQGVLDELTDTQPVPPKGVGVDVLPPFTAVARNSALVINFNDLIDADTVSAQTVRLLTGDPPSLPFEARIAPSTTHGALLGGTYHTTRVIVDFTVSTLEALDAPDLAVNTLGLPSAQQVNAPNAALRIATKTGPGQFTLLTNLSGRALSFASAGPSDPTSPTLDVVRSFRSRGKTDVTGDVNNGFLPDEIPPSVLGTQGVFAQQNDPGDPALLDVTFLTPACVMPLRVGDILEFNDFVFQVVTPGQLAGNLVVNTRVISLVGDLETFGPSFGLFKTTWSPALGAPPACFVRFDPQPGVAPATDVATQSTIIAEFSEPMDPARVLALKTLRVVYDEPPVADNPMYASVVGRVLPAADLKSFVFAPSLPLRHESGMAETYFVEISTDDPNTGEIEGVTDLAGNALLFELPSAAFTLEALQATQKTGGYALRFADPLADEDGNGKPDIRGQYVIDPRQVVKPRGFQRFSVLVADNQALIADMVPTAISIQTPLSDKGSKTQLVWRYIDMGFSLLDDQFHNLDLEGLSWASFASAVANDTFTDSSISVTHASVFPDETVTPLLLPGFPDSGLSGTFAHNLLDPANIAPTTLAAKGNGYTIQATDAFPAPQNPNVLLVPWPVNRDVPTSQYTYWTWRDTGLIQVGGHAGASGVDPTRLGQVTGQAGLPGFYAAGAIPTIGLPLLSEYRIYPDTGAFAINGMQTSFAINSSALPAFRAFSTGGVDAQQQVHVVQPDTESIAQGGLDINGNPTPGIDNTVYWGQADFVVRVSRFHTVWFDSGSAGSQYAPVVVEPAASELPNGSSVTVAFRGASQLDVVGGASEPPEWTDGTRIDPYGDAYDQWQLDALFAPGARPFTVAHHPIVDDRAWSDSLADLSGARFVQMRVTLTANADSGLTPEVAAIGVAYREP
jgi:hypothetical protein